MMDTEYSSPSRFSIKTSARFVSIYPKPATMYERKSSMGLFGLNRLSYVKILAGIGFLVVMIVFVIYHVCVAYRGPHPVNEVAALEVPTHVDPVNHMDLVSEGSGSRDEDDDDKIRYKHTKRRLPQCIIIGIRKAGTRALTTYLNMHPHISAASREIHFFDDNEKYQYGLEWYRKRMPYSYPEQLTIEKTPAYFATKVVPDRVYHMNSSIKLLLVVREPVDRTVSDYLQISLKKEGKSLETFPFEEMVLKETGEIDTSYPPLLRSVYFMYMENWLRKFDMSQFHIIDGDEMIRDPLGQIKQVEKFLGLEHRITEDNFFLNKTHGFYCIQAENRRKCLAESKGRPHPHVDPEVMSRLKEFFRPYNEKFFGLIGQRFNW